MRRSIVLLLLFLLIAMVGGCSRNTNSVKGGGTGLVLITPFGQAVLGHAELHTVTSDLENEIMAIEDVMYYDIGIDLPGDTLSDVLNAPVGQDVQRSFKLKIEPVER